MLCALSFTSLQGQYRAALYEYWVSQLTVHHVPHTSKPTLITTLGNPVKIRSWQVTIRCQNVLQTAPRASCLLSTLLSMDTSSGPPASFLALFPWIPLLDPPGCSKRVVSRKRSKNQARCGIDAAVGRGFKSSLSKDPKAMREAKGGQI